MADYRFSAKVISRGKGQSAIASAAYRAASRLHDERTGETHDYTRKGGLAHSEIFAPEGTPDWMFDRSQLWNAVEAVERRKDAQLAREIQLSLPHELDQAQRKALLLDFVQEQFVSRGMVADVAIHEPSNNGDDRNHHAHVMLTMRDLTGEGFGKKNRDWNSPDLLENWRERWAHHQNRSLERHGHEARVDHRSYEAQGIDREPTQHLGPTAHSMEANGKPSRIGDENRGRAAENARRAEAHRQAAMIEMDIAKEQELFGGWAAYKRTELENAQELSTLDFEQHMERQQRRLEADLEKRFASAKATMAKEIETTQRRLEAGGLRKMARDFLGFTRSDRDQLIELQLSMSEIRQAEERERKSLGRSQHEARAKEHQRQAQNRDRLEAGIERAAERREADGWTPRKEAQLAAKIARRGDPQERKADKAQMKAQPRPEVKPSPPEPQPEPLRQSFEPKVTPPAAEPPQERREQPREAPKVQKPVSAPQRPQERPAPPSPSNDRPEPLTASQKPVERDKDAWWRDRASDAPEPPEVRSWWEKTAMDKTRTDDPKERGDELKPAWEGSFMANDNERPPWESDFSHPTGRGRGRSPSPDGGGNDDSDP